MKRSCVMSHIREGKRQAHDIRAQRPCCSIQEVCEITEPRTVSCLNFFSASYNSRLILLVTTICAADLLLARTVGSTIPLVGRPDCSRFPRSDQLRLRGGEGDGAILVDDASRMDSELGRKRTISDANRSDGLKEPKAGSSISASSSMTFQASLSGDKGADASLGGEAVTEEGSDGVQEAAPKRRRGRESRALESERASRKLATLNTLLQRAAAYSTFLRERLQQSQEEAKQSIAKSDSDVDTASGDGARDPREPKLVTGGTLRDYQVDGVQWLISLYENGLNGILADEMGLGKTIQVVAFIAHLWEMQVKGPFLVVAPLSTLGNWVKEFKKWAPDVEVVLYHGSKEERGVMRKQMLRGKGGTLPVLVTSFEVAMNDARSLAGHTWKYLAVDEGHRLKNKDCKLLRELKSFRVSNRLLLSGTPLQNNLAELWSLLNFILPDIFDDLATFQTWFKFDEQLAEQGGAARIVEEEASTRIVSKLHAILDPFLLRRLKSDVALELPSKQVYVLFAALTETQLRYNAAIANRSLAQLLARGAGEGMANANPHVSVENMMMQMRKCCNHPFLFEAPVDGDGDWVIDERLVAASGKMQLLDRMLRTLKAHGHKVLIFFQMTKMMDLVEPFLTDLRGWKCSRIDGGVPFEERQERMRAFTEDPEQFCFLLSTRAGGLGINLPVADTVIIFDTDFNPQQDLQAQDRCHRIGQTKAVGVYRLITRDSVEVKIFERAVAKRKLELMTINRKRFKVDNKLEPAAQDLRALAGEGVDVKHTFETAELEALLALNVAPSTAGLISDPDLEKVLERRGEGTHRGQGWEVVDEVTSSFAA